MQYNQIFIIKNIMFIIKYKLIIYIFIDMLKYYAQQYNIGITYIGMKKTRVLG